MAGERERGRDREREKDMSERGQRLEPARISIYLGFVLHSLSRPMQIDFQCSLTSSFFLLLCRLVCYKRDLLIELIV